jgi:hypothetical protein
MNCEHANTSESSCYFHLIFEYIEKFNDKYDVIQDIRSYLALFNGQDEAAALLARMKSRIHEIDL